MSLPHLAKYHRICRRKAPATHWPPRTLTANGPDSEAPQMPDSYSTLTGPDLLFSRQKTPDLTQNTSSTHFQVQHTEAKTKARAKIAVNLVNKASMELKRSVAAIAQSVASSIISDIALRLFSSIRFGCKEYCRPIS
ncbi:hypothetical protein PV04_07029 [Phialophora macrospora]|uniref:Uncharacterized protein n=1 Tax=Phialophora macrospora TaxID=1851006 RepID=A0A0D2E0A8_9EURO|nr:hypothetical protein PV04_07029 [Phialophora macrospora]